MAKKKETYFVIHNGDGDTTVTEHTKEDLLEKLEEGYWGTDTKAMHKLPDDMDTNYWGEQLLIIKGEVVSPRAKKVVTEMDID